MKNLLILIITSLFICSPLYAQTDRMSEDYLKNTKHISVMNPLAEAAAEKQIKKAILKESEGDYDVKFEGYTVSSMKKGIFKYLEITGENVKTGEFTLPYVNLRTLSDFNWVDYTKNPVVCKTDMEYAFLLKLNEKNINQALEDEGYKKKLEKINEIAYPLFIVNDVRVRIRHDKVHVIIEYNFPIVALKTNKTFMVSTAFRVENGKIKADKIGIDNAYGNLSISKVANLINLIDPLTYTLELMDNKKCDAQIENVSIKDDLVNVEGKIIVKGDKE